MLYLVEQNSLSYAQRFDSDISTQVLLCHPNPFGICVEASFFCISECMTLSIKRNIQHIVLVAKVSFMLRIVTSTEWQIQDLEVCRGKNYIIDIFFILARVIIYFKLNFYILY